MLTLLLICAVAGAFGGLLQGMVGVGTGVVVIPLLTMLLPRYGVNASLAIHAALATSMAAIVITSISAAWGHHRHQNIRWDIFEKIILFSIVGSVIGALIASYMPAKTLEIIFAIFMLYTSIRMLKKSKAIKNTEYKPLPTYELGFSGSLMGIGASIVGIGGGLFMVPYLRARHLEIQQAVGTATLVGLPVAIIGAFTYILTGLAHTQQQSMMVGYLYWPGFLAIASMGLIFSFLGAKWSKSINPVILQRIFAVAIMLVGIKMIF